MGHRILTVALSSAIAIGIVLLVDMCVLTPFVLHDPDLRRFPDPAGPEQQLDRGFYQLRPSYRGPDLWGYRRFTTQTSREGFRSSPNSPISRPARFIFLGDSFTYGVSGPWEETFVGMFEKEVGHVINAGSASYSPTVYLYQYRKILRLGLAAPGHMVIVGLDISDVQDEATRWRDGDEHPTLLNPPRPQSRVRRLIADRLVGTKLIYRLLRYGRVSPPPEQVFDVARSALTYRDWNVLNSATYPNGFAPLGVQGGLDRAAAKLIELSQLISRNNGVLYLLIYPWPGQVRYGQGVFDFERWVHDLCARELVCKGVVDTFPDFMKIAQHDPDWYENFYVVGDVHLNERGNRIVFERLASALAVATAQ